MTQKVSNTTIIGSCFVFRVPGNDDVYKVELCEIAARGDYNLASRYQVPGGWAPHLFTRADHSELMTAIEVQARLMEPEDMERWESVLRLDR